MRMLSQSYSLQNKIENRLSPGTVYRLILFEMEFIHLLSGGNSLGKLRLAIK